MTRTPQELDKIEVKRCTDSENDTQPFPKKGKLKANMNLSLSELKQRMNKSGGEQVRSYIVTTVDWKEDSLAQYGSGPNFQGGLITLCTCKHMMRTYHSAEDWKGMWIAGKTKKPVAENALFYLIKVSKAYESQAELWDALDEETKKAKNSRFNILGDVFEPKKKNLIEDARFDSQKYFEPHKDHVHIKGEKWKTDIEYKSKRHSVLLVGDVENSYLWTLPKIYFCGLKNNVRGNSKINFEDFIKGLSEKPCK